MRQYWMSLSLLLGSVCCAAGANSAVAETMQSAAEKAQLVVELAERGDYGRLSKTQINMLIESRNRIVLLAADHEAFADMDQREQKVFVAARERLNRLTQANNKDRMICKKVVKTGTRLVESECLTVAQRERRAEGARERTSRSQGWDCNNKATICDGGG